MYSGDGNYKGSTSAPLPIVLNGVGILAPSFAPDEVASIYDVSGLNGDTPATLLLTTSLAGVTVKATDSTSTVLAAQLYGTFASAGQINLVIPSSIAPGIALVTITLPGGGVQNTVIPIGNSSPGIFTAIANGKGVYASQVVHVHLDGSQTIENPAVFNTAQNAYVANAINLGPSTDRSS